jgi:uracil-DNA glycosylase
MMVEPKIEDSWKNVLFDAFQADSFLRLRSFLVSEITEKKVVFPSPSEIFSAFNATPFDKVKVVLLGQDPYHGIGQAHGLSFSVPRGVATPPSLKNIYKEISNDLGIQVPKTGNLEKWATEGVLLLNATLTVRAHSAGSHQNKGWEEFTDQVIHALAEQKEHLVFLLWGSYAQKKGIFIDQKKHLVLKAPHPSPLSASRGFFGCRHFSKTNEYLKTHGKIPINWNSL